MARVLISTFLIFVFFNIFAVERSYTISMMGNVIGKSTEKWTELKDIKGECILKLESGSEMGVSRGAYSIKMETKSIVKVRCNDLAPVSVESESSEMSSKMTTSASNVNGIFNGEIVKNANRETVSFSIPQNTTFFSMIFKKISENDFLKGGRIKVISEESLTLKDITYSALKDPSGLLKITVNYDGVLLNFTLDKGIVISSDLQNGLISYKLDGYDHSKQLAQTGNISVKSPDVLENTSILNNGISVKTPRKTAKMTFLLSGKYINEIPDTCFQKKVQDGESITLSVDSSFKFCTDKPNSQDISGNLFEDSNNPQIIATAKKIVKGAPNKDEMIKRVVNFVFRHIKDKNYKYGNLSASETLAKKAGDCTEHSTLLSAMLKSLNIPVKMAYGIVLADTGKFFFHNWNEVYGDNGWVTVDSTFGIVRSDAARIMLIYGGSDSNSREQVSLAVLKFLDSLKISVNGFKNE